MLCGGFDSFLPVKPDRVSHDDRATVGGKKTGEHAKEGGLSRSGRSANPKEVFLAESDGTSDLKSWGSRSSKHQVNVE